MQCARSATLVAIGVLGSLTAACQAGEPLGSPRAMLETAAAAPGQRCRGPSRCTVVFTVQPSNTAAGATITPAVQVTIRDPFGNTVTGFTGNVTIGIEMNPTGGKLSGTRAVAAVAGVATFSDLSIDRPGAGYTLRAISGGLTPDRSAEFTILGPAAQLVFTQQPSNTVAGAAVAPAVQVTAYDVLGNLDASFGGAVTIAIAASPGGGVLSGTTTVAAFNGVATFSNLTIDKAGVAYQLSATAAGLTGATSALFNIIPGPAAQLVFTIQPTNTIAGAAVTPAVQVTAQDVFGNTDVSFLGAITIAIALNPGGGVLAGTTIVAAFNGVATFPTLSIDKAGVGYQLSATVAGLTGATSAAFDIVPGAATQLVFTIQPSNTAAGAAITPAVQVRARDMFGNTDVSFVGAVTIAITVNPGGGVLSGTTTVAAFNGVATFSNLSIDKAGVGYQLSAVAGALTPATAALFNVF